MYGITLTEKGFPPALYYKATTSIQPTIGAGAEAAQARPKEKKEKIQKEENADNGGSTKTKMTRNRCARRRIPPRS